jgi:hypothetical protein
MPCWCSCGYTNVQVSNQIARALNEKGLSCIRLFSDLDWTPIRVPCVVFADQAYFLRSDVFPAINTSNARHTSHIIIQKNQISFLSQASVHISLFIQLVRNFCQYCFALILLNDDSQLQPATFALAFLRRLEARVGLFA